jgi:hypothetical protein
MSNLSPIDDYRKEVPMSVTIRVFDPAMCCSTGVCGPSIDPELTRFAGDVAAACELSGTIKAIAPGGAT